MNSAWRLGVGPPSLWRSCSPLLPIHSNLRRSSKRKESRRRNGNLRREVLLSLPSNMLERRGLPIKAKWGKIVSHSRSSSFSLSHQPICFPSLNRKYGTMHVCYYHPTSFTRLIPHSPRFIFIYTKTYKLVYIQTNVNFCKILFYLLYFTWNIYENIFKTFYNYLFLFSMISNSTESISTYF